MIKINLLAEGKRTAVRKTKPAQLLEGKDLAPWLLLVGSLVGLLAFGAWWYLLHGEIAEHDQEIASAQREVDRLQAVLREVEDYKQKKAELERKIKLINDLKLNQRGPVRVMDDISRALPELLWLDTMKMGANTIELTGRAFNTNAVANFIENLDKMPEFEEPTLKDTQEQTGGIYKFQINFNYNFAPLAGQNAKAARPAPPGPPGTTAVPKPAAHAATSAATSG
jgi:type IV pilus assembly protein PilN